MVNISIAKERSREQKEMNTKQDQNLVRQTFNSHLACGATSVIYFKGIERATVTVSLSTTHLASHLVWCHGVPVDLLNKLLLSPGSSQFHRFPGYVLLHFQFYERLSFGCTGWPLRASSNVWGGASLTLTHFILHTWKLEWKVPQSAPSSKSSRFLLGS